MWGRSDIEGRIICAKLGVKLHVIESHILERKEIWTHQIVDGQESRSLDTVDYDSKDNTVHVMNTGFLHFQPILRIKQDQQNKHPLDNLSDHEDKINEENELNDVMKRHNLPRDKLSKEPPDQLEDNWYYKKKAPHKLKATVTSRFYLATAMHEAPSFGDVVFKCEGSWGSKATFVQTKHKGKKTEVTKDILLSGKVFNLKAFFANFRTIKKNFSCEKNGNSVFGQNYSDMQDCSFILFTNAPPQFTDDSDVYKKAIDQDDIMNFGDINYYYRLSHSENIYTAFLKETDFLQEKNLNEFLSKLKLFLGQPNEHELEEIIKRKIQSVFTVEKNFVDQVFAGAQHRMQEWHRCKGRGHFLTNENRYFEDAARVSIKFNVKEPVDLFTGRKRELENLHKILQNAGEAFISQTASITGLGGVGKTELVRRYISEYSKEYDDNVIWINAENYVNTTQSFIRVAEDKLGMTTLNEKGKRKEIQVIVQEIYEYFTRMYRRSLFVFDNCGRYRAISETDEGVDKFLPSGRDKPHVIITSRDQEWGKVKTLPLDVFSEEEAAELISKALKDILDVEETEVKILAAELQYLPLALAQAVAYIKMENRELSTSRDKRFTVSKYLKLFEANTKDLLCSRGTSKILDQYSGTVMTTWQITIAKIRHKGLQGEEAIQVLKIMSYLAPDKIPVDVIFQTLINDEELRHSAVELLDKFCIVSLKGGKVNVHRLVQQVTRIELEEQSKFEEIIEKTFELLLQSFPRGSNKLDDISRKKLLLPHFEMFLCHVNNLVTKKTEYATKIKFFSMYLQTLMADGYFDLGEPKRQKELLKGALPSYESLYGRNHFEVAITLVNLGNAYNNLGNPYKQKELLERALKIQGDHYGPNHFQVSITLVNLSMAYGSLGDSYKQKELLERALKILEDYYGPNYVEVASALVNLGNTYGNLGDHHKKRELLERALKILEDHYGPNHFEVARTLVNLGSSHGSLGDPYKQKELSERALKILENHYGPDHFEVAITLEHLGSAYGSLGDPYKEKELLERALKIKEDHYGPNHFQVALTLGNLGDAYSYLGDVNKKKELCERALKINEDHYGPNHFQVAITLQNLGSAYGYLGDHYKQKELLERALKIQEDHYGPNHFQVATTLGILGCAYGDLGDPYKEKELLERALKILNYYYGPNHFQVAMTLQNLGSAYGSLGDPYKEKELLERALKMLEDYYGPNHFQVARTLVNLSKAHGALDDPYKQKELSERALKILEVHYGPSHFEVAITLVNLGGAHGSLGDPYKEKELLERALKILEDHYGSNHSYVAITLQNLGCAYGSLGDPYEQKDLLERALKILEDHYGPNHYKVAITLQNLGSAYGSLGDPYEQKELLERALKILEDHYGPNHYKVAITLQNLGSAYGYLGDHYKQKELLERALKINEDYFGPDHLKVCRTLYFPAVSDEALNEESKGKELMERAVPILEHHVDKAFVGNLRSYLRRASLDYAAVKSDFFLENKVLHREGDILTGSHLRALLQKEIRDGNEEDVLQTLRNIEAIVATRNDNTESWNSSISHIEMEIALHWACASFRTQRL